MLKSLPFVCSLSHLRPFLSEEALPSLEVKRSDLSFGLEARDKEQEMFVLVLNEAGMWVSEWLMNFGGFIYGDFYRRCNKEWAGSFTFCIRVIVVTHQLSKKV